MTAPTPTIEPGTGFDVMADALFEIAKGRASGANYSEYAAGVLKAVGMDPVTGEKWWADAAANTERAKQQSAFVAKSMGPLFDNVKAQMLVCMVLRQPDKKITIPVTELDNTGGWVVSMAVNQATKEIILQGKKKH